MIKIGVGILSEILDPKEIVETAVKAESSGLEYVTISDHIHPWIDEQGNSPFVWSVLGAISQRTKKIRVGTAVTAPIIRIHPITVAQAAATCSILLNERFFLGIGTGENLNEHVVGAGWPCIKTRRFMLDEAVTIIRLLWEGGFKNYYGEYYRVEQTKIYNLPEIPPTIIMAASGPKSAIVAGDIADGFMSTNPDKDLVRAFEENGGKQAPKYGQLTACYAKTFEQAKEIAYKRWPTSGIPGQLSSELALPKYFEQAATLINKDSLTEIIICGSDPAKYIEGIREYINAGFNHIHISQVGYDQDGFLKFLSEKVIPKI